MKKSGRGRRLLWTRHTSLARLPSITPLVLDILTLFSLIIRNRKNKTKKEVQSVFTESLAQVFWGQVSFGLGEERALVCWLLVHPLHLTQDLALIHGQHGGVLPHLLEHGTTLKFITGLLEVVPEERKTKRGM